MRAFLALVIVLVAIPAFAVWAFLLLDIAVGFGLNVFIKWILMAFLVLPLLAALYYLAGRTRAAMVSYTAQRPRVQPRVGWAIFSFLSFAGVLVLAVAAFAVFIAVSQPGAPGSFYTAPSPLPSDPPGTIIRSEPLDGAPEGANAWKILYLSTGYRGEPVAVSATLVVPTTAEAAGVRPVVAFAHGTVGVSPNCAPSLRSDWADDIDGLNTFLEAGYAVVATDYEGMGTSGTHPYLVGESAARNVLDSVRAAHNFPEANAGTDYIVWGYSQGGHAALFTGELSSSYAPELQLIGVAAGAPPTDLGTLFERDLGTTFGNVLGAYAFQAWSKVYDDAELSQVIRGVARPVVRNTSQLCIREEQEALAILPGSIFMKITFLSSHPADVEPWKSLFEENSPGHSMIPAPIFIVQGAEDGLVHPDVTEAFADDLCARGHTVEYRSYPDVHHITAVPVVTPDVAEWIVDRFTPEPAPSTCP